MQLAAFNENAFKKDNSPALIWARAEGLGLFLVASDFQFWMMGDVPNEMAEIVAMFGTLLLTSLETLDSHGLFRHDSPIKNIGFITTTFLDFALGTWQDVGNGETGWTAPVVRSLDKAGIEILSVKEMDSVGKDDLAKIRAEVARKEGRGVYETAAKLKSWTPDRCYSKKFDMWGLLTVGRMSEVDAERIALRETQWNRWDWKKEVSTSHITARLMC